MPRGDRTGPAGMGSRTGRGAGFCSGIDAPGFASAGNQNFGGGFGRGAGGGGRGFRNMNNASGQPGGMRYGAAPVIPAAPQQQGEQELLKRQVAALQSELKSMAERLAEISGSGE